MSEPQNINLGQSKFIERFNKYLQWNDIPSYYHLDEGGVCKGLALVYGKYCLEKREEEFVRILNLASSIEPDEAYESVIMQFFIEVLKGFSPKLFGAEFGQHRSDEVMDVNGAPLFTKERIALIAGAEEWTEIFKQIDLKDDEVIFLSSHNHAITIKRTGDGYTVYDPNYDLGPKTVASAESLITEMKENIFCFQNEMVMRLKVVSTDPAPRPTIPPSSYYENMMDLNVVAQSTDTDTITLAARNNDAAAIRTLLTIAAEKQVKLNNVYSVAQMAAIANSSEAFTALLTELDTKQLRKLFYLSVANNSTNIMTIIKSHLTEEYFLPSAVFRCALRGQNTSLIEQYFIDAALTESNLDSIKILLPLLSTKGKNYLAKSAIQDAHDSALAEVLPMLTYNEKHELAKFAIEQGNVEALPFLFRDIREVRTLLHYALDNNFAVALAKFQMHPSFPQLFDELPPEQRSSITNNALRMSMEEDISLGSLVPLLKHTEKLVLAKRAIYYELTLADCVSLFDSLTPKEKKELTVSAINELSTGDNLVSERNLRYLISLSEDYENLMKLASLENEDESSIFSHTNYDMPMDASALSAEYEDKSDLLEIVSSTMDDEPIFSKLILEEGEYDENALSAAIKSSHYSVMSVHLMIGLLKREGNELSLAQKTHYLSMACKLNNPMLLEVIIGKENEVISKDQLACMKFNTKKISTPNLEKLKELGVFFSPEMNHDLKKRQLEEKGMKLPIGVYLRSFIYYMKNIFNKSSEDKGDLVAAKSNDPAVVSLGTNITIKYKKQLHSEQKETLESKESDIDSSFKS